MSIPQKLLHTEAALSPMRSAVLHVTAEVTPVTATPAIAATAALVGAFAAGFAVGQASARG